MKGDEIQCCYQSLKFWFKKHQLDIKLCCLFSYDKKKMPSIVKSFVNYNNKPEDFSELSLAPMAHSCLSSGPFEQYQYL